MRVMLDTPAPPDALTHQQGCRVLPATRFVFERGVVGHYQVRSCINAETDHVRSVRATAGVEHPSLRRGRREISENIVATQKTLIRLQVPRAVMLRSLRLTESV
jgi:aspartate carbamoyltransferase catalytic subunit